jgi:L-lactate dehydrogenase complex protein LldG
MSQNATFDTLNTTSKENMRRKIRHALTQKSTNKYPYFDPHADLFLKPENVATEFFHNFRNAGGKFIACNKNNFVDILHKLIVGQRYNTILNTNESISPALTKRNLNYVTSVDIHQQVDVAIVYADILIARTGSMLFTQRFSLYPSVRNITKDIIVVAFAKNLVLDLKDAFVLQQEKNQGSMYEFVEIITPTKPVNDKDEENYSSLEPRFILLLIQE